MNKVVWFSNFKAKKSTKLSSQEKFKFIRNFVELEPEFRYFGIWFQKLNFWKGNNISSKAPRCKK